MKKTIAIYKMVYYNEIVLRFYQNNQKKNCLDDAQTQYVCVFELIF